MNESLEVRNSILMLTTRIEVLETKLANLEKKYES